MTDTPIELTWTCTKCDEVFARFAPAERHANQTHGGARIAIDVPLRKRP